MPYQANCIYHIYNQGNNKQRIFFEEENYYYFLGKIERYILPYSDLIAYCLMPNHFHLLLRVNEAGCQPGNARKPRSRSSLFRSKTKSKSNRNEQFFFDPEKAHWPNYVKNCIHYIHQNPVKANLVIQAEHWPFSSARDYRTSTTAEAIVNTTLGRRFL